MPSNYLALIPEPLLKRMTPFVPYLRYDGEKSLGWFDLMPEDHHMYDIGMCDSSGLCVLTVEGRSGRCLGWGVRFWPFFPWTERFVVGFFVVENCGGHSSYSGLFCDGRLLRGNL